MTIDIAKGKYWGEGITLVESCTPCSPGCDHCWALAMEKRFKPEFKNQIKIHPERLKRFNTRKPKVFSIWNDLFHEDVPDWFILNTFQAIGGAIDNIYLILTKRPQRIVEVIGRINPILRKEGRAFIGTAWENVYFGLTVCNQQETDGKHEFLAVPGNLFLSLEPLLSDIDLRAYLHCPLCGYSRQDQLIHGDHHLCKGGKIPEVRCVILGGETGPGARPLHPDWVRSVRDQCAAAGVPFFFKSWGAYGLNWMNDDNGKIEGSEWMDKGIKKPGRLLDGRTHDELPWRQS